MELLSDKCSSEGCEKKAEWKGLCRGCYNRNVHKQKRSQQQEFLGDLSTEELGKIVEASSNEKSKKMEEAFRFVIAFDLKRGEYKISTTLLFRMYKRWSKTPTTKANFFYHLSKLFDKQQTVLGPHGYYMDIAPFEDLLDSGKAILSGKTLYAKEDRDKKAKRKN